MSCTYMYMYMYIHVHVHVHNTCLMYMYMYMYIHVHVHVHNTCLMYMSTYMYIHVHVYVDLLNPLSGLLLETDVSQSTLNITFSDSEIMGSEQYLLNYTGTYVAIPLITYCIVLHA